jgi:hypothetical protein
VIPTPAGVTFGTASNTRTDTPDPVLAESESQSPDAPPTTITSSDPARGPGATRSPLLG